MHWIYWAEIFGISGNTYRVCNLIPLTYLSAHQWKTETEK